CIGQGVGHFLAYIGRYTIRIAIGISLNPGIEVWVTVCHGRIRNHYRGYGIQVDRGGQGSAKLTVGITDTSVYFMGIPGRLSESNVIGDLMGRVQPDTFPVIMGNIGGNDTFLIQIPEGGIESRSVIATTKA